MYMNYECVSQFLHSTSDSLITKYSLYTLQFGKHITIFVIFMSGDGKSHYIQSKLHKCSFQVVIPVNESFSFLSMLKGLRLPPLNTEAPESEVYGIFFNFTMCYPKVSGM